MATSTNASSSAVGDEPFSPGTTEEHPLAEAGKDAGQRAGHLAERAADIGIQGADRVRTQAADGIEQLAGGVRRVSGDLEQDQPQIAGLATTAADGAERLAGWLRDNDARDIIRGVEDVARRQPLLFVGGAFLLGAAASRFIKAAGGGSTTGASSGETGYDATGYAGTSYGGTRYGGTAGTVYGGTTGTARGDLGAYSPTDPTDEGLRP